MDDDAPLRKEGPRRRRLAVGLVGALAVGLLWLSTFTVEYDRWLLKADPLSSKRSTTSSRCGRC